MADSPSSVPASSQSDGRWKIAYVPTGSDPLSVAVLKGATAKDLTFSFTPDGFNLSRSQATVSDPRLALVQILERPGKLTETLALKYVASTDVSSADVVLTDGLEGQFVIRRAVDNKTEWTIAQKVDVITFVLGVRMPDPYTENGVDTVSRQAWITAVTKSQQALIA